MTAETMERTCHQCGKACAIMSLDDAPCSCRCHFGTGPCGWKPPEKGPIYLVAQTCKECGSSVLGRWTPDGADPPPASCSQHS